VTGGRTPGHRGAGGAGSVAAVLMAALALPATPGTAQRLPDGLAPTRDSLGVTAEAPARVSLRPPAAPLRWRIAVPASASAARDSAGLTAGVFVAEVVGGSLGSVLGFYGGARAGGRSCDFLGGCGGEDPGLGRAILGALVGSWLGLAVGSHVAGGLAGGPAGSWGNRLGSAAGGILAAMAYGSLVHTDIDRPITWVPLPIVAAAVTALAVPRHR
jgi:hypothetical protein